MTAGSVRAGPAASVQGGTRIESAIRQARAAGRTAIAAFVTGGFPDLESFGALLEATGREADLVEVGVPFSDPMADGLTIQRSSRTALERGATLQWILEVVREAAGPAPILLMSYLNPILAYGLDRLAKDAAGAGVAGFIVPDLPLEESDELRETLRARGIALVQLVTPATPDGRLERVCRASEGFVYAVTLRGTTGTAMEPANVTDYLKRVRAATPLPVLAGFGVRTASDVRALTGAADGVIVGSALIEAIEEGRDPAAFVRGLRGEGEDR
jgi:tryptophan synthase alpha chain